MGIVVVSHFCQSDGQNLISPSKPEILKTNGNYLVIYGFMWETTLLLFSGTLKIIKKDTFPPINNIYI